MHSSEQEKMRGKTVVSYASTQPRVVVCIVVVNSLPLTAPPIGLWRAIAIVVIAADDRRLGVSIPIWEVGLLVGRHGRLDLGFGLVVPFGTIVGLARTGRYWGRVSFIGRRIDGFGRILTEREWLLAGNLGERGDGGRAVSGLVPRRPPCRSTLDPTRGTIWLWARELCQGRVDHRLGRSQLCDGNPSDGGRALTVAVEDSVEGHGVESEERSVLHVVRSDGRHGAGEVLQL